MMESEKQKNRCPPTETTFYVVGPRRIQNDLIASCLKSNLGNECVVLDNINQIPTGNPKQIAQTSLVLWDCFGEELQKQLTELKTYTSQKNSKARFIFFNVSKDIEFKKKFVLKGIHGFFFQHDSLDIFLKGVQTVLDGKLWLSRDIMTKCIFEERDGEHLSKNGKDKLTDRQTEILALISVGATNDEIADKLCISSHTVKTHLYKIFKKINVPNRVQAALWAAKNL